MSIKKDVASLVGKTPLWRLFEIRQRMPRILFYHGVINDSYVDKRIQANQILLSDFEKQIRFLKREFVIISLDDFYQRFVEGDTFSGKEVVLTFDDGYKNNLTVAYPFLESLGVPFTVFVCSDLVEIEGYVPTYYIRSAILHGGIKEIDVHHLKRRYALSSDLERIKVMGELIDYIKTQSEENVNCVIADVESNLKEGRRKEINGLFGSEQIMSWADVERLNALGVTIGSHSQNHAILHSNQSDSLVSNQLIASKKMIVNHIGHCNYFAFPNGDRKSVSDYSINQARLYYKMSFAVNGSAVRRSDDIAYISRISASFDLNSLKVQLSMLS